MQVLTLQQPLACLYYRSQVACSIVDKTVFNFCRSGNNKAPEPPKVKLAPTVDLFTNDGNFMEKFLKLQKQQKGE